MKLKITMAAALFSLLAAATLFAQSPERTERKQPTAEQTARRQSDRMQQSLKLDEQQTELVYKLRLDQIRREEARREALRKEREADEEALRKILTEEQYAQWQKQQKRAGNAQGGARPGEGRGPRGNAGGGFPRQGQGFGFEE